MDITVTRGEVWWANCEFAIDDELWDGTLRPVLLLSRTSAPEVKAMMIVAPTMADISGIAIEVSVGLEVGLLQTAVVRIALPREGRILCDWLVTLSETDLVRRAGALSPAKLRMVEDMLVRAQLDPARWA